VNCPSRCVAIGGGTGLPRVLQALLGLGCEPTAIVTMADDGGSSGTLREELDILPPGDARNCLVALADPDAMLSRLFQYRFDKGAGLEGHALGNLVLAALVGTEGGFPEALEAAGRLLGSRGSVVPSTLENVRMEAVDRNGDLVFGQSVIACNEVPIESVEIVPSSPMPYTKAIEAIEAADLIVIGPGSLFTSIIPNFLVAGVADAVREANGIVVYICNVANQRGETEGMDAARHVEVLAAHGLEGVLDAVVVHDTDGMSLFVDDVRVVDGGQSVRTAIEALGIRVVSGDLAVPGDPLHHSPSAVAEVLREVM